MNSFHRLDGQNNMKWLTIERTTYLITLALLFAIASRVPLDTDTWWHIRSGEHTLSQGMIYQDPFSHTQDGERWINHSWGAQIVLYGAYQVAGNVGLALYTAILAVAGMAFLLPICAGNIYLRAFLLALSASTASVFWSARPQMFSFFFSAVALYLLFQHRKTPSWRILLFVPMMWLWANLHAGYSIGFIFWGAFLVGETLNRMLNMGETRLSWRGIGALLGVGGAALGVLVLTPYGLDTLRVPFETVGMDVLRQYIQEWNSPNFQRRETWMFILMVVALLWSGWISRLAFDWTHFFLASGTLFMALLYGRNIAVFAVASVPLLSQFIHHALTERGWVLVPRKPTPRSARLNAILLGIVFFGVAVYVVGMVWSPTLIEKAQRDYLPVEAVAYLRENPAQNNLLNGYNWGGYLMFALPEMPVFIDGRTDLYGEFVREWLYIINLTGDWRADLDRYGINTVFIERGIALDYALRTETEWEQVYGDDLAVIYARKTPITTESDGITAP